MRKGATLRLWVCVQHAVCDTVQPCSSINTWFTVLGPFPVARVLLLHPPRHVCDEQLHLAPRQRRQPTLFSLQSPGCYQCACHCVVPMIWLFFADDIVSRWIRRCWRADTERTIVLCGNGLVPEQHSLWIAATTLLSQLIPLTIPSPKAHALRLDPTAKFPLA